MAQAHLNQEGTYEIRTSKGEVIARFRCRQPAEDERARLVRKKIYYDDLTLFRVKEKLLSPFKKNKPKTKDI